MCGTLLEARRPPGAPPLDPLSAFPAKISPTAAPETVKPAAVGNATRPANQPVPPISGPSMLGLNQPDSNQPSPSQPSRSQSTLNQPSVDFLREKSFSGFNSFLEPEQPKTGGRRILLLAVLLAALGAAGWWTYTNYLGAAESRKPQSASSSPDETPAEKPVAQMPAATPMDNPATKSAAPDAATTPNASSQAAPPPAAVPAGQPENPSAGPTSASGSADAAAKPVAPARPATATPGSNLNSELNSDLNSKTDVAHKSAPKREPSVTAAKRSSLPEPAATDTGDAAFRKGEAFLYGRGVPPNCEEAVKYLKTASAKSSAKARSALGTMYDTGHCVPRDLPTSYLWFALALRADPNNQILEKDLIAVWNQMTPPERQLATRMKQ